MDLQKVKCPSCANDFEQEPRHTLLGFQKFICSKCAKEFLFPLTNWYRILYIILFVILLWMSIKTFIEWWFPISLIFAIFLIIPLFKDYYIKKHNWLVLKPNGKKWIIVIWIMILFGIISAIFQPSPVQFTKEQEKYIWEWKWDWITLLIWNNSYINYKKQKGSVSTSISGPIVEFNDNNFKIGIWFFKTTFTINKKPLIEWNQYKMTIDWNKLTRNLTSGELVIPEIGDLKKLTNNFFTLFNNSVFKDDYKLFYNSISKIWQSQTSEEELKKSFVNVNVNKIDLNEIIKNDIVFTKPPYLDENNLLILEGYYVSKPQLQFILKFIYEYPKWEIVWFNF